MRTVIDENDQTRVLLTYKEPALDADSDSKPEHETTVENANIVVTVLTALGVKELIAFQKHCVNYRFTAMGHDLLATLVTVPELEDQTFIELETMTEADDLDRALNVVRSVLRDLGISEQDLTVETYTDAVSAQRKRMVHRVYPWVDVGIEHLSGDALPAGQYELDCGVPGSTGRWHRSGAGRSGCGRVS